MTRKSRLKGIIIKEIPAKKPKCRWEIFASHNKKLKKAVRFKSLKGIIYQGYFEFGTRLIAQNGNVICLNPKQFNTINGAKKNISAVKASA